MARTISRTSLTDDAGISTGVPDTRAGAAADVDKIGRAMPLATPPASRMLTATTPAPMLRSHASDPHNGPSSVDVGTVRATVQPDTADRP